MNIFSVLILNVLIFFGHAQVDVVVPDFSIALQGTTSIVPNVFDIADIYSVTLSAVVDRLDGATMKVTFATSIPFSQSALGLEIPFEGIAFSFEEGFFVPSRAELLILVEDIVSSPDYLVALQQDTVFASSTVVTFIAPEDTCFSAPGVGIFGCLCHPSCATCGYFVNPTALTKFDCLTCADGFEVISVFEDGSGYCKSIVDPDAPCRLSPEVGIDDCECHPSCGTCGYYNNPVSKDDCITCANDSAVNQLFQDGTGTCATDEPTSFPTATPTPTAGPNSFDTESLPLNAVEGSSATTGTLDASVAARINSPMLRALAVTVYCLLVLQ